MSKIKEMSVVGGIAPSGSDNFNIKNNSKVMRKNKLNKNNPTMKKSKIKIKERVNLIVRDIIYEAIIDKNNPSSSTDDVLKVYDNLGKQIEMSIRYSRVFISDGLKIGDNALKFSMKRAYAELERIKHLAEDMQALMKKVNSVHLKQVNQKQQDETPDLSMPKEGSIKKESYLGTEKMKLKKEDNSSATKLQRQDSSNIVTPELRKLDDDEAIEDPTIVDEM